MLQECGRSILCSLASSSFPSGFSISKSVGLPNRLHFWTIGCHGFALSSVVITYRPNALSNLFKPQIEFASHSFSIFCIQFKLELQTSPGAVLLVERKSLFAEFEIAVWINHSGGPLFTLECLIYLSGVLIGVLQLELLRANQSTALPVYKFLADLPRIAASPMLQLAHFSARAELLVDGGRCLSLRDDTTCSSECDLFRGRKVTHNRLREHSLPIYN
jgi:hypothetical protein